MRRSAAMILLGILAAGCVEPDVATENADEFSPEWQAVVSAPTRVVGSLTREPAIERTPEGVLFVSGCSRPVGAIDPFVTGSVARARDIVTQPLLLWKSTDEGGTWSRVNVGTPLQGAIGNSDVDLAVAPDGTVYVISMSFTLVGHSLVVGASEDAGVTWRWSVLSLQPLADRPWIEVAPDGRVHAVWNDGVVVHHASSVDRGRTWTEGPRVHLRGGDGMLAVSPGGDLAVRIIPTSGSGWTKHEGQDGVAVSSDRGMTWMFRRLPGTRDYQSTPEAIVAQRELRWADPLAYDVSGNLVAAWPEGARLFIATSPDHGATWRTTELASFEDSTPFYPHLRAGPEPGVVAITWLSLKAGANVTAHAGLIRGLEADAPRLSSVEFLPETGQDTGGEYFQAAFLDADTLGVATPLQVQPPLGFEYRTVQWTLV